MEARILDFPPDPETDPENFYHPHEEDSVPGSGMHGAIMHYLEGALGTYLPNRWVASDLCCYWIPGNNRVYLAPDVFVAAAPRPEPLPNSFRNWEHGPLLLVIEIASRTSLRWDVGPKLERYAEGLRPHEYLYYDADHQDLRLQRRTPEGYALVHPDSQGRVWSESAHAFFLVADDHFLRAFNASGEPLLSHAEEAARRTEEATRRQEAERRAVEEATHRQEAERRATEEATRRQEAERRAAEETALRSELEARLAAMEAELARLKASNG